MTQKPRRQKAPVETTVEIADAIGRAPDPTSTPAPAPAPAPATLPEPPDRLSILNDYTGPDGLLPVFVAVSHDALFAGQHVRVPVTDRVAGLIERGFLEVDPVEDMPTRIASALTIGYLAPALEAPGKDPNDYTYTFIPDDPR